VSGALLERQDPLALVCLLDDDSIADARRILQIIVEGELDLGTISHLSSNDVIVDRLDGDLAAESAQ